MLEKTLEQKLKKAVESKGGMCMKFTSPGLSGVPDRIVIASDGRMTFVEMKRPGGQLSPRQVHMIGELAKRGREVHVIDSIEKLQNFITWL